VSFQRTRRFAKQISEYWKDIAQALWQNENKQFSYEEAGMDFEFQPLSFEEGIKLELRST
jgi:hypothetical protein